jgi:hypothetical protein
MGNYTQHRPQTDTTGITEHKDHVMKFIILLPLAILSITDAAASPIPPEVKGSQWQYVDGDSGRSLILMDTKRIAKGNGTTGSYILRTVTIKPYYLDDGRNYSDSLEQYQIECQKKTINLISYSLYQADGSLVKSDSTTSNTLNFVDVQNKLPGAWNAFSVICEGKPFPISQAVDLSISNEKIQDFMHGKPQ